MSGKGARTLLICYGEGGHHTQARRLAARLQVSSHRMPDATFSLTDKRGIALEGTKEIVFEPLRLKHAGLLKTLARLPRTLARNARQLLEVRRICHNSSRVVLVSLGPAFAALPALVAKACGGEVVHIETWSRFTTRSVAGRLMYRIANQFLIQNEELQRLYPRARYSGRL